MYQKSTRSYLQKSAVVYTYDTWRPFRSVSSSTSACGRSQKLCETDRGEYERRLWFCWSKLEVTNTSNSLSDIDMNLAFSRMFHGLTSAVQLSTPWYRLRDCNCAQFRVPSFDLMKIVMSVHIENMKWGSGYGGSAMAGYRKVRPFYDGARKWRFDRVNRQDVSVRPASLYVRPKTGIHGSPAAVLELRDSVAEKWWCWPDNLAVPSRPSAATVRTKNSLSTFPVGFCEIAIVLFYARALFCFVIS